MRNKQKNLSLPIGTEAHSLFPMQQIFPTPNAIFEAEPQSDQATHDAPDDRCLISCRHRSPTRLCCRKFVALINIA